MLQLVQDGLYLTKEFYFGVSENNWEEIGRVVAMGSIGLLAGLASISVESGRGVLQAVAAFHGLEAGVRLMALFPRESLDPPREKDL